ncbi:MAG: hypothetical protein KAW12_23635 [Candidatus Aminicenantes bacterium]|nr:hypothetical protein [Candidatus Aminicenantes bacterium]
MEVMVNDFESVKKEPDIKELIYLLKIPEVRKVVFHLIEKFKIIYRKEIDELQKRQAVFREIENEGNIIRFDREKFFAIPEDERVKEYIDYLVKNPALKEAVLEEFFSVAKPFWEKKRCQEAAGK